MTERRSRLFTAYGQPLALNPRAFGMVLFEPPEAPTAKHLEGGIALVEVQGPLMHHPDPCADSYDAIKGRVVGAIAEGARKIVLSIDSPGGLVSGCFDTADEIRAACDASGVELYAYVDGQATSAAYALACVASKVYVPSTGIVGSIGVIDALVDATAQDAAFGLTYSIVASGARKADGNPHAATTDAAVAAAQARVDSLASLFFDHVAKRRGIATEKLAALQAGLVHGAEAVSAGLADGVASLDQVLALVRTGADAAAASAQTNPPQEANTMDDNEKAYRASLQAVVDDENADAKAKARASAILAAMDGEPDGDEPKKDEESKAAEGDDEKKHDEPDGDEKAQAIAALAKTGNSLEARVSSLEAQLESERKSALRASRPDVAKSVHDALSVLPLAQYSSALGKIEKPKKAQPAATASVRPTLGEGQKSAPIAGAGSSPMATEMAKAMGLAPVNETGVRREGNKVVFNPITRSNGGVR